MDEKDILRQSHLKLDKGKTMLIIYKKNLLLKPIFDLDSWIIMTVARKSKIKNCKN